MLLSFRVGNHRSLFEEQQLNLTPVYEADRPEGADWEAVPVAAIFGANAAGKSNVVDALRFMTHMVLRSHQDAEPDGGVARRPFALDPEGSQRPSWYVVDVLLGSVRYTYGFSVDDERVRDEWLYAYPRARKRKIFERSADVPISFGDAVPKKELELVESITPPNALFMSVAARSRQSVVQDVYQWFSQDVSHRSGGGGAQPETGLRQLLADSRRAPAVVELLKAADLGIDGAEVETREVRAERVEQDLAFLRQAAEGPPSGAWGDRIIEAVNGLNRGMKRSIWIAQRGREGSVRMSLADQSQGTRVLLEYAAPVLDALDRGGLLVIDEVDASLHPRLTAHLIRLFQEPATNPRGAQLVLTTHDASLLGRMGGEEVLKRDQIWFVEKNEFGETTLFPLSDFKPRQQENRERRYLGGSYGAVPFLSDERFEEAIAMRGRSDGGEEQGEPGAAV